MHDFCYDVGPFPIRPKHSSINLLGIRKNLSENEVAFLKPYFLDFRIEVLLRPPFVQGDPKSCEITFFFKQVEFILLKSMVFLLVVGLAQ